VITQLLPSSDFVFLHWPS